MFAIENMKSRVKSEDEKDKELEAEPKGKCLLNINF